MTLDSVLIIPMMLELLRIISGGVVTASLMGCASAGLGGLHGGVVTTFGAPTGPTSPTIGEFVCVFKDAASAACPTQWALCLPGQSNPPYYPVTVTALPVLRTASSSYTLSFSVPAGSSYTKPATITSFKIIGNKRTTVTVQYQ